MIIKAVGKEPSLAIVAHGIVEGSFIIDGLSDRSDMLDDWFKSFSETLAETSITHPHVISGKSSQHRVPQQHKEFCRRKVPRNSLGGRLPRQISGRCLKPDGFALRFPMRVIALPHGIIRHGVKAFFPAVVGKKAYFFWIGSLQQTNLVQSLRQPRRSAFLNADHHEDGVDDARSIAV